MEQQQQQITNAGWTWLDIPQVNPNLHIPYGWEWRLEVNDETPKGDYLVGYVDSVYVRVRDLWSEKPFPEHGHNSGHLTTVLDGNIEVRERPPSLKLYEQEVENIRLQLAELEKHQERRDDAKLVRNLLAILDAELEELRETGVITRMLKKGQSRWLRKHWYHTMKCKTEAAKFGCLFSHRDPLGCVVDHVWDMGNY